MFRPNVNTLRIFRVGLDTAHLPKSQRPVGLSPILTLPIETVPSRVSRQMQSVIAVGGHKTPLQFGILFSFAEYPAACCGELHCRQPFEHHMTAGLFSSSRFLPESPAINQLPSRDTFVTVK
jgi:hypothetical protein